MILLAAGVWIYQIISEYQKSRTGNMKQLQEYVKVEKNTRDPENTKPNVAEDDKEGEKQEETVTVDFASLQAINPDYCSVASDSGGVGISSSERER